MPLRKLQRHPEQLGSLDLFADLDRDDGSLSLQDVRRQQEVVARFSRGLSTSLSNTSRTHGWRVQALFETVVVALEGVKLLKTEDAGDCFFDESVPVKLPDFRIVLDDQSTLLVEVKNVAPGELTSKLSIGELEALQRYAELSGARLVFAHYWSTFNVWTLVDPVVFERRGDNAHVALEKALMANEFAFLGDLMLGIPPPMVLRVWADPAKPRTLKKRRDNFASATFTIKDVDVLVEDRLIADEDEREIAMGIFYFGGWEATESIELGDDDEVLGADFTLRPIEDDPDSDLSDLPHRSVAFLSSICSTQFNLATLGDDGAPSKLRLEPGTIAPLVPRPYWDREDRELPLLGAQIQPSLGPRAEDPPDSP